MSPKPPEGTMPAAIACLAIVAAIVALAWAFIVEVLL
jgi:hypothetical protein